MKDKFFGYIPYNEETLKELWGNAVFVLDANILLNLYRYSKDTQKKVIDDLKKLTDRVWIPYNTAEEFFNNRLSVIKKQKDIYKELLEHIRFNSILSEINSIRHITLSEKKEEMIKVINECQERLKSIIGDDKENNNQNEENILNQILEIFDGKVGEKISDDKRKDYINEIEKRYENKIPPGYKDSKKDKASRKYGDCINWFSIIEYAKENDKDIIYITDDNKEDWFSSRGDAKEPRVELLQEFYKETNKKKIYIYNTEGFVTNFNLYIENGIVLDTYIIDEIKEILEDEDKLADLKLEYVGYLNDPNYKAEYIDYLNDPSYRLAYLNLFNRCRLDIDIIYKQNINENSQMDTIELLANYLKSYYDMKHENLQVKIVNGKKMIFDLRSGHSIKKNEVVSTISALIHTLINQNYEMQDIIESYKLN